MTNEEARWILKFHRPDRPRSTDRRQLQKAIDVILEDQRPTSYWVDDEHGTICHHCGSLSHRWSKFCPDCGAQMGGDHHE